MSEPRFYEIYKKLPPGSRNRFTGFVQSPVFNTRQLLIDLLQFAHYQVSNEEDWDSEGATSAFKHKKPLTNLQLNNLLSDLLQLLYKFISIEYLESKQELSQITMTKALHQLGASKVGWKASQKAIEGYGAEHAYYAFEMLSLKDQFRFELKKGTDSDLLDQAVHQLDLSFALHRLSVWCELANRKRLLGEQYDEHSWISFENWLDSQMKSSFSTSILLQLYIKILAWLKQPEDDTWYSHFLDDLNSIADELTRDHLSDLLNYIQNYCVLRINEGKRSFLQELLRVYQMMVQFDVLVTDGYLSEWTYKNIVTVGVRTNAFEWTEQFVHDHYSFIEPKVRDNAYMYNLAVVYQESGQLQKCQSLLARVKFTDPVYYLDAKCLLLRIYFQEEAEEALYALRESVNIYLLRQKKFKKTQKILYKNLFGFTYRLFKIKYASYHLKKEELHKKLHELQHNIDETEWIANRYWLKEKCNELKIIWSV